MPFRSLFLVTLFLLQTSIVGAFQDDFTPPLPDTKGKWDLSGEMDLSILNDRALHYTGSETSFLARLRLQGELRLEEHIGLMARFRWEQPVGEYSRLYEKLKKDTLSAEDLYLQVDHLVSEDWLHLQAGIIKVPFGIFDTLALDDINRPIITTLTREWDAGIKVGVHWKVLVFEAALVNGEGRFGAGRDTNSGKSGSGRLGLDWKREGLLKRLSFGVSAYTGKRYSTPVKEPNSHWGGDFTVQVGWATLSGSLTRFDGGPIDGGNLLPYEYQEGLEFNQSPYDHQGWYVQLALEPFSRWMIWGSYSEFDPNIASNFFPADETRKCVIAGSRYVFFKRLQAIGLVTFNDNPEFDAGLENTNRNQGDNAAQLGVRVDF